MDENIILEKCLKFTVRMLKLAAYLHNERQHVIADQIFRSGSSIGANIAESEYAATTPDFINKIKIAEKEASETAYWLRVLLTGDIIDQKQFDSLYEDVQELRRLIGSSLRTLKSKKL